MDADWQTHRAEYVRIAPHSHAAHIVVKVDSLGAGRSKVVVIYTVTAFAGDTASLMAAFSGEAYAAKMLDWQQRIIAYVQSRK